MILFFFPCRGCECIITSYHFYGKINANFTRSDQLIADYKPRNIQLVLKCVSILHWGVKFAQGRHNIFIKY